MTVLARPQVVLGGDWNPLDRAIRAASARLTAAGARMEAAGARLSARVTLPLLGIGAAAAKASADWETAMVGVQKTVDATTGEIAALGNSLVRMSERIPVASNELAAIAAEAGQLGIATANLRGFTEAVAALRVSTNLGDQAASTLARLANIMGTSQTEFGRMGSTIVELGNNLATTEAEIADMALRIAGAGTTIGLTEAQVLSFAGALSSVGVRSEAGGTAISRVMVDIATAVENGGQQLQRFAAVAGTTSAEFRRRFETDAAGAVAMFITGLGDLESQGKSTFGTLEALGLADIRVRDVLLRASSASDLFTEALDLGSKAWEENTALSREAGLFFGRLAAQFSTLVNKAKNVTAEFGDALRPAIDAAIQVAHQMLNIVRGLVARFAELDPQVRIQIALWTAIAAAVGPALVAFGALISVFGSVLGAVALVGSAIAGLALVIIAVKNDWLGLGEAGARAWDTIVAAAGSALDAIVEFVRPIANFLIGFFVGTARAAFLSWDIIRFEFVSAFGKIRDFARPVLEGIASGLAFIGRLGAEAAAKIRDALSAGEDEGEEGGTRIGERIAAGFAEAFATDYVGAFVAIVQTGIERARAFIARAIESLRALAGGVAPEVDDLESALDALGDLESELDRTGQSGQRAFDAMGEAVEQLKIASIDFAVGFADAVGSAVTDGIDAFKRFGEFVLRTLATIAARLVIFRALSAAFPGSQFVAGLGQAFGFAGEFAHGGTIPAGRWGIVGERGPELVSGPATVAPINRSRVEFVFPAAESPTDFGRDQRIARMIADTLRNLEANGFRLRSA